MMVLKRLFFIIFFISCITQLIAQVYDGHLTFEGKNYYQQKPLTNTTIKIVANSKIIKEFNTKEESSFKTVLPFGKTYDIYFSNARTQKMFIRIHANDIPENKRHYKITYALDIPFFTLDATKVDSTQFTKPFHQVRFDGNSKFVDDTVYMNTFLQKVYIKKPEPKKDTTVPILTTEKIKEYLQLAGKLHLDNDKKTPIRNKTVVIKNKKGEVVAKVQTSNQGKFVFKNVASDNFETLEVIVPQNENPTNQKILLSTADGETIESVLFDPNFNFIFKNINNQLSDKLENNEYSYFISAKLIATNETEKKIGANKTVYLLNNKNTVIQKAKTNSLGIFYFKNIVPGYEYRIAYDSADAELNFIMNLYSLKDKFIRRLDSVANKKFIYKFLAISDDNFNELLVDESELKMNFTGRLYGNNKNNPLGDMKVLLLNDKFQTIDSATTNKEGDFSFKHLPYTKQVLLTINNENSILESFNNIMVFDNSDNLIKLVSLIKGKKFQYKPLKTEFSKLADIYVEDPWLSLVEKKAGTDVTKQSNTTIMENILFEFNKAELQPQSQLTLDKVVLALKNNEQLSIELSAHSDSKGSDSYNLILSERRANSAKNYIISKGIDANRIIAKGYGESKLLNNCGNDVICSDDEHAINRRLEFKLIFK